MSGSTALRRASIAVFMIASPRPSARPRGDSGPGQPVETDDLADIYSNRQFGKVFWAIQTIQEYLQPVFGAAGSVPFNSRLSQVAYRSAASNRILELHDKEWSIRAIAEEVGCSRMKVQRVIQRHRG